MYDTGISIKTFALPIDIPSGQIWAKRLLLKQGTWYDFN